MIAKVALFQCNIQIVDGDIENTVDRVTRLIFELVRVVEFDINVSSVSTLKKKVDNIIFVYLISWLQDEYYFEIQDKLVL